MQEEQTCPRCKGSGFDPDPESFDWPACRDCDGHGSVAENRYFADYDKYVNEHYNPTSSKPL